MVRLVALSVALVSLLEGGCSSQGSGSVTGMVQLDGEPVAGAQVVFIPQDDIRLASNVALTGQDGKFELKPNSKVKLILQPGKYKVVVTKFVKEDGSSLDPGEAQMLLASGKAKNLVPEIYAKADMTPLRDVEITSGDNALPAFELKTKLETQQKPASKVIIPGGG